MRLAEQLLAVKISSEGVLAAVWSVEEGKVTVGATGKGEIVENSFDGLLKAADKAVSEAVGTAPVAKVIFGLNPDWIFEGKIAEERLGTLKKLCRELDLRPLGYVPLFEALENYFKETEGAPLTAILIGLDKESGWVSLYRAGKNLGTVPLPAAEDITLGIEQALQRFNQVDVLPARMIIYDGQSELAELEEKIMAHPWTKQLPFLHFPKVEAVTAETVVKAVAGAAGSQMGGKFEEEKTVAVQEVSAAEAGFAFEEITHQAEFTAPKINLPKIQLPKFSLPKLPKFQFNFLVPVVIFFLLILGFALAVYFVPKVKTVIHLSSKAFDKEMDLTAVGEVLTVTEIGTKKGVATGKKMVGDKAKGTVTIYSASAAKTFPEGTLLTSPEGLKFILDQDTPVASASDFLTPSTAIAKVTAVEISDKYNLAANTKFTIGTSASYLAKNDSAFAGGNAHEAIVITKEDQNRLMATLSAEFTVKAQNDLRTKLSSGQSLLPNAVTSQVAKKKFSKDIDQEGDTVNLDLTVDFKGVVISKEEVIAKFKEKFSADIPAGFDFSVDQSNLEIKSTKQDKTGNLVLTSHLTAKLLPQINGPEIIKNIAGKSSKEATKIIMSVTGVSGVDFEVNPKFFQPVVNLFLPWRSGAITNVYLSES